MQKEKKYVLYLNNLDLPKIKNYNKNNNNSYRISKTNPNLKRRIEEYKIKDNFKLPKIIPNTKRYYQILTTEDIKELARNFLKSNSNKNIFKYLKGKNEKFQKKLKEQLKTDEPHNLYGNKIKNIIRLHSSKYHPEDDIKNPPPDDFDKMLNKLKYGNYDLESDDREIKYRQRLAFKYRFLKNNKNTSPINFSKMNSIMNKLLSISKSIPNYLLIQNNKDTNIAKREETNKKTDSVNNSIINLSSIYSKNDKKNLLFENTIKRKRKSEEKIKLNNDSKNINNCNTNRSTNIISYDKNGKKYIHHLSLLLFEN